MTRLRPRARASASAPTEPNPGYEESARYWERRQRTLVRRLQDLTNDADNRALTAAAMLDTLDRLVTEFHDHDWDGEPEPEADEARS